MQRASRTAWRAIIAGATMGPLAGLVPGHAPFAGGARAQDFPPAIACVASPAAEIWVCTGAAPDPLEFLLTEGVLSEQPLGLPRYRLLANTTHAVIGEDHYGDFDPVLGTASIFVSTVMIDRITGNFMATTSAIGRAPQHREGSCRRFEKPAACRGESTLAKR